MLCEEFFQGHIVFIGFRGRACRGDLVPAVRKNRHRGIGVAAGSIVSAVATQVYKNVLKASGEKLQNAVPFVANDKDGTDGAGKSGDDATTVIAPAESEGEQTKTLSAEESDETTVMTSVDGDTTTAMPATSGRVISSAQAGGRESNMLPDNAGGSIQHAGRRASFDAWLHGKRAPIVIAIVSALIGVAVSAGLILAFTGGHGTDTVVRDMVNSKQTPSDDNAGDSTYGSGNNGTQDNMQNQSGTTDTDKDSTTNSDRNNGKDTGKKTDSTTGGTGTSTDGSSTNTGDDSNKTDSSTDSTTPSDGSTSGTNNSGQSGAGTTTTPNGSASTNQNPTPNGSNPNGTSSGTSGNGTDTSK